MEGLKAELTRGSSITEASESIGRDASEVAEKLQEPGFLDSGSDEALSCGCTCSPISNDHGKGLLHPQYGVRVHRPDRHCPLHGMEVTALLGEETGG